MTHRPLVYVIILNYCSLDDTLACVTVVRRSDYDAIKLLVIDNASPDGSGKSLKRQLTANEFLQTARNVGYAGGNNLGIKRAISAGADFVLILNPDVRIPPDAVSKYIDIMVGNSRIGALNSIQLQDDGVTIDRNFSSAVLGPYGYREKTVEGNLLPELFDTNVLFGAALMLSKKALMKAGGFDPLYFAYGEELDLCRRLQMHGFRLTVTRQAPVRHLRTIYKAPLSTRIIYLRLRGHYLGLIKNHRVPMVLSIFTLFRELIVALAGSPPCQYPFDLYKIRRITIARALLWFLANTPLACIHRHREKTSAPHYL